MGHKSTNTTIKHYGHLTQSVKKEEIRKKEGFGDSGMNTFKNDDTNEMHITH